MSDAAGAATTRLAYDCLFQYIAEQHGARPWGRVLDAGTGAHSLEWVAGLPTAAWTAVTGDAREGDRLRRHVTLRPADRVLVGNWTDPELLAGEVFDVVLADYLLGAVEGFAPYFQADLFERLRPHVGGDLYVVGLEPYEMFADTAAGGLVKKIARLRDACILLGGGRCYREFPRAWVEARLGAAGFAITRSESFPICYGQTFVRQQIAVGSRYLPSVENRTLARSLKLRLGQVEREALRHIKKNGGLHFGEDYVIHARA